jgi:hypothetical protein
MKRFIKKLLLENWSLKATAILLSLILWLFVRGEPGPERVVAVPLEVQLSSNMEIVNERPTTVEITMRGAAFSNTWFNQPLPICIIDLQRANEGEHIVQLNPENVKTARGSGINVLQVNPARVFIVLQQTISKEVPIIAPLKGEPAYGYEIYGKQIKPSSVVITGPRLHIDPVSEISAEPVLINEQKQPGHFFVNPNLKDNFIRTSLKNPIQVDVQIGPRRKLHTVSRVSVIVSDSACISIPRQISIQVNAPINLIESISSADFSAVVDMKNINCSDLPVRMKPEIRLAGKWNEFVEIKQALPPEVTVRAAKPPAVAR